MKYTKENSKTIAIRVTLEEYNELVKKTDGRELSVFIRERLFGVAKNSQIDQKFTELYSYLEDEFADLKKSKAQVTTGGTKVEFITPQPIMVKKKFPGYILEKRFNYEGDDWICISKGASVIKLQRGDPGFDEFSEVEPLVKD